MAQRPPSVTLSKNSRLTRDKFVIDDEIVFWSRSDPSEIKIIGDTVEYTVPQHEEYRPDLISYRFYGVTDFWWAILEASEIRDVDEVVEGTILTVPGRQDIEAWLEKDKGIRQ